EKKRPARRTPLQSSDRPPADGRRRRYDSIHLRGAVMSQSDLSAHFRQETEAFLNAHLDDPDAAWPARTGPSRRAPHAAGPVFAPGPLLLDHVVGLPCALGDYLEGMASGEQAARSDWAGEGVSVGGAPAHAIRLARAKGWRCTLGGALPRRRPPELE